MTGPQRFVHQCVQIVTTAKFSRRNFPSRCDFARYHVFAWTSTDHEDFDAPPKGLKCQCGALTATGRQLRRA